MREKKEPQVSRDTVIATLLSGSPDDTGLSLPEFLAAANLSTFEVDAMADDMDDDLVSCDEEMDTSANDGSSHGGWRTWSCPSVHPTRSPNESAKCGTTDRFA